DGSASIRPFVADGSVAAVVEVLAGVSRVTSPGRPVTAAAGGATARTVRTESVGALPREVHDLLSEMPLVTGFRTADGSQQPGQGRTVLCVVSDGVPADLPTDRPVALAVLAAPSARDVLAPGAPETTAWVPVGERGSQSAYSLLMDDEPALRDVVAGLLRAVLPAESTPRSRLAEPVGLDSDLTVLRTRMP
ncbi:MAG: hypothetical protein Q4F67_03445, partial [Propionibacteriaceae bacterium]|nr:hypothetical protein [Propionibacteriaceae bacterium]